MAIVRLEKGEEYRGILHYVDIVEGDYGTQTKIKCKGPKGDDVLYFPEAVGERMVADGLVEEPDRKGGCKVKGRPEVRILWPEDATKAEAVVEVLGQAAPAGNSRPRRPSSGAGGIDPPGVMFLRLKTTLEKCREFALHLWGDKAPPEVIGTTTHTLFISCKELGALAPGPVPKMSPQQADEIDQLQQALALSNEEIAAFLGHPKLEDLSQQQAQAAIQKLRAQKAKKEAAPAAAQHSQEDIPW